MQVIKRDGSREDVSFDKVLLRIRKCAEGLDVNPTLIAQKTLSRIHDGVKTSDLDELAAQLSISLITTHPDYGTLASHIIVSNHHKNTNPSFVNTMRLLANQFHEKTGLPITYLSPSFMEAVEEFQVELDAAIRPERDFLFDYFGFKTLERQKYLLRSTAGVTLERPQHMWMRVAVALWGSWATNQVKMAAAVLDQAVLKDTRALAFQRILETYELLSTKQFIHATPTLFNAGSERAQMSSCYLQSMAADSISGIYKTLADCAQISKYAGGIGLHISDIRARGSYINGNGGLSTGIVPMLRNFNATARYVDQGSKRNGSFAIYLEPWHADLEDFLKLKLNTGSEEERARDLFYGLWIPDLFMERIETDGKWTLFCPSEAPGLADVWGAEFKALYEKYEAECKGRKVIEARHLWERILVSQIETGTPYLLYKDAANGKSNQQNLGTIKSSNLCVAPETLILTRNGESAIEVLYGQEVEVWNGHTWSRTVVQKTSDDAELLRVLVNDIEINTWDGTVGHTEKYVDCTLYHKFILRNGERIEAAALRPGMLLASWTNEQGIQHVPTVHAIHNYGRHDVTYCFNEPLEHAGVFNGILAGNCTEIIEFSSPEETAVCNLASLALPAYVNAKAKTFDFEALRRTVKVAVRNLNRVIDINFYPTPETRTSNMRHRPIGLGVQGLADVFALLRMPWEQPAAARLNQLIFEHMYYAALEASADLAELEDPYSSFAGSPASKGLLQFDLWSQVPITQVEGTLDWASLKGRIQAKGLRNSLLVAPMPTASTSQILGYNECFEPFTSNIYTRRTLAGEYIMLNKHLVRDLLKLGLWSEDLKNQIIVRNGSVQGLDIPAGVQALYKTAWEIKQKTLIDMSAARGAFVCQSQSLNLFVPDPTHKILSSMHFYGWKKGLKTGIYYLRTKPQVMAQKFTIDPELQRLAERSELERQEKEFAVPEGCLTCSA
uniref:ribonucleoside-diphosphate reductase n=1 Tax=viral metagenome TaxID=1070528 RepID=A0A6C0K1G8_9ZZZZ